MADRRSAPRQGSTDRRKAGQQFGRGDGVFADTVNKTFAILRQQNEIQATKPEAE